MRYCQLSGNADGAAYRMTNPPHVAAMTDNFRFFMVCHSRRRAGQLNVFKTSGPQCVSMDVGQLLRELQAAGQT